MKNIKYKQLVPYLPKYSRNYLDCKVGDICEGSVMVFGLKECRWRPNDPELLEHEVTNIVPLAKYRYYNNKGMFIIYVK